MADTETETLKCFIILPHLPGHKVIWLIKYTTLNVCPKTAELKYKTLTKVLERNDGNQVNIVPVAIFRRILHPMNFCRGCPVGTWGVSQVNLMKNSTVIGS